MLSLGVSKLLLLVGYMRQISDLIEVFQTSQKEMGGVIAQKSRLVVITTASTT